MRRGDAASSTGAAPSGSARLTPPDRPAELPIQLLPVERTGPSGGGYALTSGRGGGTTSNPPTAGLKKEGGWGRVLGFLLVLAGASLAAISNEMWASLATWAGEPWSTDTCRWILSGILVIGGVSFLSAKPIAVLVTSAIVLFTIHCVDVLAGGKVTALVESIGGTGAGPRCMAVAAVAVGYLAHAFGTAAISTRGAVSLALVGLAGVGVVRGWYERGLEATAPRLTADAAVFIGQWGEESTWAAALVIAAIGVALSRTKLVHFLTAMLLGALAYHCIQAGCVKVVSFPGGGGVPIPDLETVGLGNVAMWRWVAAGELVLLGLILLHLSLGIGGLNMAFAIAWMAAGLAAYNEIGRLSLARSLGQLLGEGVAQQQASQPKRAPTNPLSTWGLPLSDPTGAAGSRTLEPTRRAKTRATATSTKAPTTSITPSAAGAKDLARARQEALNSLSSSPGGNGGEEIELVVSATMAVAWMYLTALLAGIIATTGLHLLVRGAVPRALLLLALWFGAGLWSAWLGAHWPRNPDQSWVQWLAAFGASRYHEHLIWLVFLACVAVAGLWALWFSRGSSAWIHASVYCTFLGTFLSLIAVAGLILYGGFPRLPVWTYIALAAGQSSLAWVLLMHLSLSGGKASQRA